MKIPVNAFRFCKISVAILLWCSFIFKYPSLLIIVFIILFLSALLKIRRAPMIVLYSYTIEKIFPSAEKEVHEKGLRFAHTMGTILSVICLTSVYLNPVTGWWVVLGFCILKTVSNLGFCPGEALYSCYENGSCSIMKK